MVFQNDTLFLLLGGEPQTFAFSRVCFFLCGVAKITKLKHSQDFHSEKKTRKLINSNDTVLCIILVLLSN